MTVVNPETRIILRRWRDTGDVIALMPDVDEGGGMVSSYMHHGQHGPASPRIIDRTDPVDPMADDALALMRELRAIGYVPRIIRRMPSTRTKVNP